MKTDLSVVSKLRQGVESLVGSSSALVAFRIRARMSAVDVSSYTWTEWKEPGQEGYMKNLTLT